MRRLIVICAMMIALCAPARADEGAIRAVISAQIEAFEADDVTTAFTFASPTIRQIFGSAERFGQMVQQGYPMVWRPAKLRFLGLVTEGGDLWQQVLITDQQGTLYLLEYQMVELENGWKINAVRILPEPPGLA